MIGQTEWYATVSAAYDSLMDTRSALPRRCAYCYGPPDTRDHAFPKCLLKPPLPSNAITVHACQKCNSGFSFAENVVRSVITLIGRDPYLVQEREPGARLDRALKRDKRLRDLLASHR